MSTLETRLFPCVPRKFSPQKLYLSLKFSPSKVSCYMVVTGSGNETTTWWSNGYCCIHRNTCDMYLGCTWRGPWGWRYSETWQVWGEDQCSYVHRFPHWESEKKEGKFNTVDSTSIFYLWVSSYPVSAPWPYLALTMDSAASFTGGGNSAKKPLVMAWGGGSTCVHKYS